MVNIESSNFADAFFNIYFCWEFYGFGYFTVISFSADVINFSSLYSSSNVAVISTLVSVNVTFNNSFCPEASALMIISVSESNTSARAFCSELV